MSSILDALKKLEKGKIHRDGISTAIATDILRAGKKRSTPHWRVPLVLFLLAIAAGGLLLLFFRMQELAPVVLSDSHSTADVAKIRKTEPPGIPADAAVIAPPPARLPLLSGILYQQPPETSMAILNDLPVMKGTIVAGYTLQEIFADRVILSRQGESFTLTVTP
ncbi:MAG: hypothetical protein IBX47_13585 [Desulfuromonadales bacterium]|nr:hypothetical protein [Desulfuromonadales bacterium]MBE0502454.1 hypothetical protein [Desulfuromonadales bacterium]